MLAKQNILLWSGGLDSTWTLKQLHDNIEDDQYLYCLSLTIVSGKREVQNRMTLEKRARKQLLSHFPKVTSFYETSIDVSSFGRKHGVRDTWLSIFHASLLAKNLYFKENDLVWMGANCEDDFHEGRCHQKDSDFNRILNVVSQGKVTWIKPEPKRQKQIADLGNLSELTWSCRNPTIGQNPIPCGKCKPCKNIKQ